MFITNLCFCQVLESTHSFGQVGNNPGIPQFKITFPARSIFSTTNLLSRKKTDDPPQGESEDDPLDKTLQSAAEDLSNKISGEKGRHVATDLIQKLKMMKMTKPEREDTNMTNGQQNFGSILSKMTTDQVKHRGEGRPKRRGQRDDKRDNRKEVQALSGMFDDMSAVRYQDSENYDYHAMKKPNPQGVERKYPDRKSSDQRGPRKWTRQPGADRDFKLKKRKRNIMGCIGERRAYKVTNCST
ncbi:unnamed protein product [Mytilus edulis]|uniref:Uncharacterized protein n=1 Tax=Mytilus edulis TaxID=6550 RepID=A0A8S3T8K3_MYTED|nr:unnamed protein product [Mytilus edulis]